VQGLAQKNRIENVFETIYFMQCPSRKDFMTTEEEVVDRSMHYLDMDRRLIFVDDLNFSLGSIMSLTNTDEANVYFLGNQDPRNVTNGQRALNQLLGGFYQFVCVCHIKVCKKVKKSGVLNRYYC